MELQRLDSVTPSSPRTYPKIPDVHLEDLVPQINFLKIPSYKAPVGSDCLKQLLKPILSSFAANNNFDEFHSLSELIDFYEIQRRQNPGISLLEALKEFPLNLEIQKEHGGYCFALCEQLLNVIPRDIRDYTYQLMATIPKRFYHDGTPLFYHTLLAIPFENPENDIDCGIALLDPTFAIVEPIIVRFDGSPTDIERNYFSYSIWRYIFCEGSISCYESKDTEEFKHSFKILLNEVNDPGKYIYKTAIASIINPAIITRNLENKTWLDVLTAEDKVTWTINGKDEMFLSFDEILAGQLIDPVLFQKLNLDPFEMEQKIKKIIQYKDKILEMNREYRHLISDSIRRDDFYFSGALLYNSPQSQ